MTQYYTSDPIRQLTTPRILANCSEFLSASHSMLIPGGFSHGLARNVNLLALSYLHHFNSELMLPRGWFIHPIDR